MEAFKIEHDPSQPNPYLVYRKQDENWTHLGGSPSRQVAEKFITDYVAREEIAYFDASGQLLPS